MRVAVTQLPSCCQRRSLDRCPQRRTFHAQALTVDCAQACLHEIGGARADIWWEGGILRRLYFGLSAKVTRKFICTSRNSCTLCSHEVREASRVNKLCIISVEEADTPTSAMLLRCGLLAREGPELSSVEAAVAVTCSMRLVDLEVDVGMADNLLHQRMVLLLLRAVGRRTLVS